MNQDDGQIVEEFFNILHKTAKMKGISEIRAFFTNRESNTNNMDREEFRTALLKLGYDENSFKYEYLMKKYQNYFSKNLINLHIIQEEYEIHKQKFKEDNTSNVLSIPSGFNSNFTSPIHDVNKVSYMKSGFQVNQTVGDNFLTPKSNFTGEGQTNTNENFLNTKYLNSGYEIGFNRTFPMNDKLNSNPISFRDEENNLDKIDNIDMADNKFVLNKSNNNSQHVFNQNQNDKLIYEPGLKNNLTESSLNQPPTFAENSGSKSQIIKNELQELDRRIKEDLEKNMNYIKVLIYENFQNNFKLYKNQMERDLKLLDPSNDKFISQENFLEFCENYVILDNYEKNILLMDVVRNATTGKYSYEDFLEKVKNFDLNEKIRQTKNFNLNYNDYIVEIRKVVNANNIDLKRIWKDLFQTSAIIDLHGFYSLLTKLNFNYQNEEVEYIFNKIADEGKISFRVFESVIKRNPPSKNSMEKIETEIIESLNKEGQAVYNSTTNANNMNINSRTEINSMATNNKTFDYYPPGSRSMRDQKFFDELKTKNEYEIKHIIEKRIKQRDTNVLNILKYMENFKLYQIYHYLALTFKSFGNTPQILFQMKDLKQEYYISQADFIAVLNELKLILNDEQKDLLIKSLPNKNNSSYLYSEFLRKVYSYNSIDYVNLMRSAHLFYNDYVIEFRNYISEKKIDIVSKSDFLFPKVNNFNFSQFQSLIQFIGFTLSHIDEYKYLFNLISIDGQNLNLAAFLNVLDLNSPDVEAFIEKGNLSRLKEGNKSISWKNKIDNYTEELAKNYKKNFPHLSNIFADINGMVKKNLKDVQLIDFFDDCLITADGDIDIAVFINKISKLGIKSGLNNLLTAFANQRNRTFNMVKFFNVYFCFYPNEKKQNSVADLNINTKQTTEIKDDKQSAANDIKSSTNNKVIDKNDNIANTAENAKNPKSKIVYKNFKRDFTEEDIEFIQGVISELTDIIITEKKINVADYLKNKDTTSKGYFLIAEFSNLLDKDFDFDVTDAQNELEILYDYLVNEDKIENKRIGKEHIKITSLIEIFKNFAKDGIDLRQSTTINNKIYTNSQPDPTPIKETRENMILKEFSKFLFNRKIKFSQIFPNTEKYQNEEFIMLIDFKNAFTLCNYSITHDDVEFLIKYFDPYNKMRISFDSIKSKIKEFVPNYFDMPFQKIDREKIIEMQSLHKQINNNPGILNVINKVNSYIESKRLSVEEFFKSFSKHQIDKINKTEFVQQLINFDKTFSLEDLQNAFNLFDRENLGHLTLNTFYLYFNNSQQLTHDERKDKISINNKMLKEINSLFDFLDKDKDEKITKDEFYQALKSYNENVSLKDAEIIIKTIDREGKNYVDRKSFLEVMENHLKEQMVLHEEEKEYVIRLFKEEDIDKVGFLTPNQMRHLLLEKLKCTLEDYEIDELINEVDVNGDGMIDIDEFIRLLESEDSIDTVKHTLRQINLKRKISPMTFLSIFSGLPMNFIPSFIKEQQKLFRLLPSASLKPRTDQTGILFQDILRQVNNNSNNTGKSSNLIGNSNNFNENYLLRPIITKINAKISFQTATGVAIPDEFAINRNDNIVGRILKIVLFNHKENKLIGNSINIEVRWDKEYEDRWYFDEDRKIFNNNVIIRYNNDDFEYISVIYEFVILIKKEDIITETSCGWSSCELRDLTRQNELKLDIKGGSPIKNEIISKSDIRTKRSGWAKVAQFFSGQVKSQLPITIKPYKDLTNNDRVLIDYLPACIIIHKAAINLCSVYRKYIAKEILNNKFYSLKVIKTQHPIINNFCKIVDCPDTFKQMIELWNTLVVDPATMKEKKDDSYWENNLIDFVNKIYSILYADRFEHNELDPTRISVGNLNQIRIDLINSSLKYGRIKKNSKTRITPVENKTAFKPFSISELYGKRIDIVSKLDELIPDLFLPGFFIGIIVSRLGKTYFTMEPVFARPWSGIFLGVTLGSLLHYYGWRKRLMIEEICIKEELNERRLMQYKFSKLKAGQDIENELIQEYLKNEDNI